MKRVRININGDSKEMLRAELRAALSAVDLAIEKCNALTVHGRNYPFEPESERVKAWQDDLQEKRRAVAKILEVKDWLEDCALNIAGQHG